MLRYFEEINNRLKSMNKHGEILIAAHNPSQKNIGSRDDL